MKYSIRIFFKNIDNCKTINEKSLVDEYGILYKSKKHLIRRLINIIIDNKINYDEINKIFIDKIDGYYGVKSSEEYDMDDFIHKIKKAIDIIDKINNHQFETDIELYKYDFQNIKSKIVDIITSSNFNINNIVILSEKRSKLDKLLPYNKTNELYDYIENNYDIKNSRKLYVTFINGGGYCIFINEEFDEVRTKLSCDLEYWVIY